MAARDLARAPVFGTEEIALPNAAIGQFKYPIRHDQLRYTLTCLIRLASLRSVQLRHESHQ